MLPLTIYMDFLLTAVFAFALTLGMLGVRRIGYLHRARGYLSLANVSAGAGDGIIDGVPLLDAAVSINGHVIDALGRVEVHSTAASTILAYFREHSSLATEHFVDYLKGYVAESIVGDHFSALGHHVVLAANANQAGWDLLIDGEPFQVKSGTTAARHGVEHLLKKPDIPVITSPEAAQHLNLIDPHSAIAVHDIAAAKLEATTSGTLHSIDTVAHAGTAHFPIVTVAVSSYKEIMLLYRGNTEFGTALGHIVVDALGVGVGMAGGAKAGVLIGARAGLHGAAIGGFIGSVVGGVAGKIAASFAKEATLRRLCKVYRAKVSIAALMFQDYETRSRNHFLSSVVYAEKKTSRELGQLRKKSDGAKATCKLALSLADRKLIAASKRSPIGTRSDLASALTSFREGRAEAFIAFVRTVIDNGDEAMVRAVEQYILLNRHVQSELLESLIKHDGLLRSTDLSLKDLAASVLEDLAQKARELFSECNPLRSQIEYELRRLGKPVPALTVPDGSS
jgi:hypothetical protein